MSKTSSEFEIPEFARMPAYSFEEIKAQLKAVKELNTIAEEIEKCRQRNS